MKNLRMVFLAALAAVPGVALPHHSTAEFDFGKNLAIAGKVVELQWTNPHAFIELLVPAGEGKPQTRWSIEIGTPNVNRRMGWSKSTVKPGDQVRMEIAPTRDGKPRGTLREMTLPDGRKIKGIAGLTKADDSGAPLILNGSAPQEGASR